jgi:DNA-binding transcriptional LysR family regulator
LLQWLVAPNLAVTSCKFPNVAVCLQNLKSSDVVSGLRDLRLDLGFVRENALPNDLGRTKIGELKYGLYVPRKLVPKDVQPSFAWVAQKLPLACQYSDGEFQHQLQVKAEKAKVRLRISVECETFPQAAQLLLTETHAAVLPSIASPFLDSAKFVEVPTTWLKTLHRPIAVAWNKRTMNIRPVVDRFRAGLEPLCKI